MIKRKNLLFIMILVILLGVIPNILKISGLGVKVGTLISYEPGDGDPPVIDGNLIESEWLSTDSLEIRLYLFSSESTTLNITIYSLNTADILYLGAVIPNASQDISSFMVIFKTNSSEELFYFPSGELEFGDGHDAKFYCFSSDEINDCYTTSSGDIINDDVAIGGTNDTLCKSTHDATHCFVEMAIPFDSGDTIGCDL
ncbi:MAG: hypothetical protein FK734_02590, partial [Asgard group archaeon]|nr:hypothetical protein [Asgard group archaeon]